MLHVTSHVRGYKQVYVIFYKILQFLYLLTVNGQVPNRIIQIIYLCIFVAFHFRTT